MPNFNFICGIEVGRGKIDPPPWLIGLSPNFFSNGDAHEFFSECLTKCGLQYATDRFVVPSQCPTQTSTSAIFLLTNGSESKWLIKSAIEKKSKIFKVPAKVFKQNGTEQKF